MERLLPSGTVTLLFTDIEGSTRLLHALGRERYVRALTEHRRLLREAFTSHGGVEVEMQGDSFLFSFPFARDAVAAAVSAQRALAHHDWDAEPIHVRIGLHTGEPMQAEGLYAGLDVHRAARVMRAGNGGQVLLSERTADLVEGELAEGVALRDLGEHRLKDLSLPQRLYDLVVEGLASEFPPPKTLENRPTNLPVQPTPLVGRERELEELRELLDRDGVRLVTLTGPGGTGKTRLALHAAAELVEQFREGVFCVFLAPVRDPGLVLGAVAQTLGVRERPGEEVATTLTGYLRERELLLVVDNFEHLAAAAPELATLVSRCERVKLVVTSRAPLHLAGEQEYPVPPLALPDTAAVRADRLAQYEAVQLFVDRARAVKPSFQVTNENAAAVAGICVRLDGLPLALELAAARTRVLSPQALLTRLDQALTLLSGGALDADERQQTLRATIHWSYELLSEQEQTLFTRLAVFAGGCRIEAADQVCNPDHELGIDTLDALASLTEKNLLRQRDDPDGEPRFWMLETIHDYAHEHLHASRGADEIAHRHSGWCLELARDGQARVQSGDASALSELEQEHPNLRSALERSRTFAPEVFVQLPGYLWNFWVFRGHLREGYGWLAQALAQHGSEATEERERLLAGAHASAARLGDADAAKAYAEERLALARQLGDELAVARSLSMLGGLAADGGDAAAAIALASQAVSIARTHEEAAAFLAVATQNLGYAYETAKDWPRAKAAFQEALVLAVAGGNELMVAHLTLALGFVAFAQERLDEARILITKAIQLLWDCGSLPVIAIGLTLLSAIAAADGDWRRASLLLAGAEHDLERTGFIVPPHHRRLADATRARLAATLHDEEFQSLWAEGRALSLEDAVTLALT